MLPSFLPPQVLIGLAAGLATAALMASAASGGMIGRVLLHFLAPLPLFLAGLTTGSMGALLGGLVASILIALVLSTKAGLLVLLSQALPIAALCHLALLHREAAAPDAPPVGPSPSGSRAIEWYPVGRLLAVSTLMAGALAFLTLVLLGQSLEELRGVLRKLIEEVFLKQFPAFQGKTLGKSEIAALTELALRTFPAATALSWLGGLLLNLYIAGRITIASGHLARPWPDLAAATFPRGFGLAFAAALALAAMLSGYPALLAAGFAGGFFSPTC